MGTKKFSYSEGFKELQKIVEEIENEEISVDELVAKVEKASQLLEKCRAVLHKTEEEIEKILDPKDQKKDS
ncbi:MAG: exodeoxyribonuclease VII small subunit [Flavobacteriales bacterium]|jgi:exodeoxyribonuclease VII small subunit|nr:exodeoxyribonuclease VII small subunit [Flavobacteriales bacterium]